MLLDEFLRNGAEAEERRASKNFVDSLNGLRLSTSPLSIFAERRHQAQVAQNVVDFPQERNTI